MDKVSDIGDSAHITRIRMLSGSRCDVDCTIAGADQNCNPLGDVNQSGKVNVQDLLMLLGTFGVSGCPCVDCAAGGGGGFVVDLGDDGHCSQISENIQACDAHESAGSLCGDQTCLQAMRNLTAMQGSDYATSCASYWPDFWPTEDQLCSPVPEVASLFGSCTERPTPAAGASMTGNPDDWANAGVAGDGDADGDITLVGDSYLITGFGAHMDGQGDRVDIGA